MLIYFMMKGFLKRFVPKFILHWYHFALALFGAFLYGFPSRKLIVIGVTGTNGKSTVVEMCHQIFMETGFKVASASSIRFKVQDDVRVNNLKMTMPGRFQLQKFIGSALKAGCKYIILEVTSEGIKQYRHKFIDFDIAVFTNLTPEHIESHGSFEAYKKAKGELFKALSEGSRKSKKYAVVNLDDRNAGYFLQFPADKIGYAINKTNKVNKAEGVKLVQATGVANFATGVEFKIGETALRVNLMGEFNVYNALAASAVAVSQNIDLQIVRKALAKISLVPGRMEVVIKEPFKVIVDYAHTPDSLQKVYEAIREKTQNHKMICVLGSAGGGRDKWKRPELGKIAADYCDQIILTDEDPYNEDPHKILADVETGFKDFKKTAKKILDRRAAIREALTAAQSGDAVVVTGKGSEPWMCVAGGKKIPWDDRAITKEELERISQR